MSMRLVTAWLLSFGVCAAGFMGCGGGGSGSRRHRLTGGGIDRNRRCIRFHRCRVRHHFGGLAGIDFDGHHRVGIGRCISGYARRGSAYRLIGGCGRRRQRSNRIR